MSNIIKDKTIDYIKSIYKKQSIIDNPACYIYDTSIIKKNIELLEQHAPPQINLYYSLKANTNKTIVSFINSFPFVKGMEIASSGELKKALDYCSADNIIFTGPGKTEKELEDAIKSKIKLINIESAVEAIRINNIAKKLNIKKVDILVRINLNYCVLDAQEYMSGKSTKMGIDENQYLEAFSVIKDLERVNIEGIHVFAASGVLDYKSLIKSVKYIFDLVVKLEKTTNKINVIDVGGGLGIDYTDNNHIFDVKNYFKELALLIDEYCFKDKKIIMELGTYIVGNAGFYTAQIIDIKDIKGHKHIIVAGGVNHMGLPLEMRRKHPVHIIPMNCDKLYDNQPSISNESVDISGPLCMISDKLSWDDCIEEANIGDIVVFRQSGAYCYEEGMMNFLSHPYPEEFFVPNE